MNTNANHWVVRKPYDDIQPGCLGDQTEDVGLVWFWRPIRSASDFAQARARLRELMALAMRGRLAPEDEGARDLLIELLSAYEARVSLEQSGELTGASLLDAQMKRLGVGPYQLARQLGVPHARVSEVLSGHAPFSRRLAKALLELNVPGDQVLMALLAPKAPLHDHEDEGGH